MKSTIAILACFVSLAPMVASANPVAGTSFADMAVDAILYLSLPIVAEIMIEVRMLRLREVWAQTSGLLALMHCITVPLLMFFLIGLSAVGEAIPEAVKIIIAEAAIVMVEAGIFYGAAALTVKFSRGFPCCLRASAAGNALSFFVFLAAQRLAGWLAGSP